MISRATVWLLIVTLLIPSGIAVWSTGHRDSCSRFLAGDSSRPATVLVETAGRMVAVPCSEWLPRQPLTVQLLCLAEIVALLMLVLNGFGDLRESRTLKVQRRGA